MWFVDPDLLRRRKRLRWFPNEPLGMSCVGSVENGAPPHDGLMGQTVMHHSRREKAQSGMAVLVVVPGEEILRERASILEGSKAVREAGAIFQSPEVAFRIRVVVGNVRATVGFW